MLSSCRLFLRVEEDQAEEQSPSMRYRQVTASRSPSPGLWGAWKHPVTDQWLQSYTIITTDPSELMESIHTRKAGDPACQGLR